MCMILIYFIIKVLHKNDFLTQENLIRRKTVAPQIHEHYKWR